MGGCEKSLQVIKNKAARVVTKLDWSTSSHALLSQCGWLSVHQLVVYHTVVLVHKVLLSGTPKHLFNLFNEDYNVKTRLADQKLLKPEQTKAPKKSCNGQLQVEIHSRLQFASSCN